MIREMVQNAVRQGLRDFFSAEPAPSHSVWVISIEDGHACMAGGSTVAIAQGPEIHLRQFQDLEDVQHLLRAALDAVEGRAAPGDPLHFACVSALTEVLQSGEKMREALDAARRAVGWAEANSPENHPARARYLGLRAKLLGQAARAGVLARSPQQEDPERDLLEVMRIASTEPKVDWCVAREALGQLAQLYLKRDEFGKAEALLKQLLKASEGVLGEDHFQTAAIRFQLGVLFRSASRRKESEAMLRRALKSLGEYHRNSGQECELLGRAREHYEHLLVDWGIDETQASAAANNLRDGKESGISLPALEGGEQDKTNPDQLTFTVTCPAHPRSLPRGQRFQIEIAIHRAAEDASTAERKVKRKHSNGVDDTGVKLTLVFKPANLWFAHGEKPRHAFPVDWKGGRTMIRLDLTCPGSLADQTCRETIDVFVDGVRVGALALDLYFAEIGTEPLSVRSQFAPAGSAYACFAPEDRYEATGRLERVRWAVPELRVEMHAEDLRARQDASTFLKEAIARTDRFLLFWSSQAKQSEQVTWEWRQALEARGVGCIDPVRIEMNVAPPKELRQAFERSLPDKTKPARTCKSNGSAKPVQAVFSATWPGEFTRGLPRGEEFSFEILLQDFGSASGSLEEGGLPPKGREVVVTLVFQPEKLAFPDRKPRKALHQHWNGTGVAFRFDVFCPRDVPAQTCRETIRVFANAVPIGSLLVDFHISAADDSGKLVECRFEPFRSAFACCAPEDRYEAQGRLQGVGQIVPDFEVILPSGDLPNDLPRREIEESERFLLFWSSRSRNFEIVRKQWKHALDHKQIGAIDIVRIENGVAPANDLAPAFERALPLSEQTVFVPAVSCPGYAERLLKEEPFVVDLSLSLPPGSLSGLESREQADLGAEVYLVFQPQGVRFTDGCALKAESWTCGAKHQFRYELICPAQTPDKTLCEFVSVFLEGIPLGYIRLTLHFEDQGRYGVAADCCFCSQPPSYWCFAPEDAYEVFDKLERMERLLPGCGPVEARVAKQVRANAVRLGETIDQFERFVLFWSSHTEKSSQANGEWDYAIKRKGLDALDLVWIKPHANRVQSNLREVYERSLQNCLEFALAQSPPKAGRTSAESNQPSNWGSRLANLFPFRRR